jgi:hypothetical protein
MSATQSSQVRLSPTKLGLARIDDKCPPGSLEVANNLLQKNHENYHMYFRDLRGHNHIVHSLLTVLAMGGGPKELNRAYDDSTVLQRPMPALVTQTISELSDPNVFLEKMIDLSEYPNFLAFFEQEMDKRGWQAVLSEYCFSRTPIAEAMFSALYEGLYHPLIQLAFGMEFDQPSLVAEGLAHAASHSPGNRLAPYFQRIDELAHSGSVTAKPLVQLYSEIRANEKIRASAIHILDGEFGPLERAFDEIVSIAAQYQVQATPDAVERAMAEMMSCSAYTVAAQRAGKARKIDFYLLHLSTSAFSTYVLLQEDWIKIEDKARLLEYKARVDLLWYAGNGSAELDLKYIRDYQPSLSKGMDWATLYKVVNDVHDDGHIVKLVRALKLGETVVQPYEQDEKPDHFPVTGDLWLKMAQMCHDSTFGIEDLIEPSLKWVYGSGFDMAWRRIPDSPLV